jgi:hypothetical protein
MLVALDTDILAHVDGVGDDKLDNEYEQIIAMLNSMERQADKFCF